MIYVHPINPFLFSYKKVPLLTLFENYGYKEHCNIIIIPYVIRKTPLIGIDTLIQYNIHIYTNSI